MAKRVTTPIPSPEEVATAAMFIRRAALEMAERRDVSYREGLEMVRVIGDADSAQDALEQIDPDSAKYIDLDATPCPTADDYLAARMGWGCPD